LKLGNTEGVVRIQVNSMSALAERKDRVMFSQRDHRMMSDASIVKD
jgi:hypothetical protein